MVEDADKEELEIWVMGQEMSGKMLIWYFLFYPHFFNVVPLDEVNEVES